MVDKNELADKKTVDSLRSTAAGYQRKYEKTYNKLIEAKSENSELNDKYIESQAEKNRIESQFESFKEKRIIFIDNFQVLNPWWQFLDGTTSDQIEITEGTLTITPGNNREASKKEIGITANINGGIYKGEVYQVLVTAWIQNQETIPFQISVSDLSGGRRATSQQFIPKKFHKILNFSLRLAKQTEWKYHFFVFEVLVSFILAEF